jgi:hypothetical protein
MGIPMQVEVKLFFHLKMVSKSAKLPNMYYAILNPLQDSGFSTSELIF